MGESNDPSTQEPKHRVARIDALLSHIWMVRTFLKHCDEIEEDDELQSVVRDLYDILLATGPAVKAGDTSAYLRQVRKKLSRLKRAEALFREIQPEISGHTNFVMAAKSLTVATSEIETLVTIRSPSNDSHIRYDRP